MPTPFSARSTSVRKRYTQDTSHDRALVRFVFHDKDGAAARLRDLSGRRPRERPREFRVKGVANGGDRARRGLGVQLAALAGTDEGLELCGLLADGGESQGAPKTREFVGERLQRRESIRALGSGCALEQRLHGRAGVGKARDESLPRFAQHLLKLVLDSWGTARRMGHYQIFGSVTPLWFWYFPALSL